MGHPRCCRYWQTAGSSTSSAAADSAQDDKLLGSGQDDLTKIYSFRNAAFTLARGVLPYTLAVC
jgi:hypothetical protein